MKKSWWHNSKFSTAVLSLAMAAGLIFAGFVLMYAGANWMEKKMALSPASDPERLLIPSIGVNALIQSVGVNDAGRMGLPSNFTDVAWYKYGPKPGASGSAVMAGHLDTAVDARAVFAKLSELKQNDDVYIQDKNGQKIRFRVVNTEMYDETEAPLEKIFDRSGDSSRLNLITCDGAWDEASKNYSKRLVVYTKRAF